MIIKDPINRQQKRSHNKGFSLLEVLIATTLFAFFVTAYLTSQGYNVDDSSLSQEQIQLQQLAEMKINEIILDPPQFTNVTSNLKETKNFEDSNFSQYEYTLEIKKMTLPDYTQIMKNDNEDKDSSGEETNVTRNSNIEKMVFDQLKKNIEKILWQVRITVRNKETKYEYDLSTLITNYNEQVRLNFGF